MRWVCVYTLRLRDGFSLVRVVRLILLCRVGFSPLRRFVPVGRSPPYVLIALMEDWEDEFGGADAAATLGRHL